MRLIDKDKMTNNVDPDQTAPLEGAVWSGSALFYAHQSALSYTSTFNGIFEWHNMGL